MQVWDPDRYATHARFVSDLGAPVVELLDPRPGERVLDVGCGDGALTEKLVEAGCRVVAVDSSPDQVRAARQRGIDARVADATALAFDAEFEAVFSNAVLHWIRDPDAALAAIRDALAPGGRLVAEFGGHGCVASIRTAFGEVLARRGIDADALNPWYFPTAEEYRDRLGRVTSDATLPALVDFLEDGGSIVTIGGSTALGNELGLPLEDHLVKDGEPLGREEYYVPGSILEVTVDNSRLVATGVPSTLAMSFNNSPVFGATALAARNDGASGVTPLAWFETGKPLISGWAWGQEYLQGGVTMAEAKVGDGHLYLFGPLITRRAQPHGTFKFLFNAIALSSAEPDRP